MTRPTHYRPGPYEAIKVIEAWDLNFNLGNVVKYVSRAGLKSTDPTEDLKKARQYLDFEIARLGGVPVEKPEPSYKIVGTTDPDRLREIFKLGAKVRNPNDEGNRSEFGTVVRVRHDYIGIDFYNDPSDPVSCYLDSISSRQELAAFEVLS